MTARSTASFSVAGRGPEDDSVLFRGIARSWTWYQDEIIGNHGVQLLAFENLNLRDAVIQECDEGSSAALRAILVNRVKAGRSPVWLYLE